MKYTATHKHLPTPEVIGASRDARWEGVTRARCSGGSKRDAVIQIDRVAVLTEQRHQRPKRRGVAVDR